MKQYIFRFKKFEVDHTRSAMKVGVDSVLLGAWVSVQGARRILDVGCGCGILALMCAQRNDTAIIDGIEIDGEAASESRLNFQKSPWASRLKSVEGDFTEFAAFDRVDKYDLVVCNPPYFCSGVEASESARMTARHQGTLNPETLFLNASRCLEKHGKLALVLPLEIGMKLKTSVFTKDFSLNRICRVKGREELPVKRALMEWEYAGASKSESSDKKILELEEDTLILEKTPGEPTAAHRELCKDFYLKF